MTLLVEDIPKSLDYEWFKKYITGYAKVFSLEKLKERDNSWDAILNIPYVISRLMIIEVLDGQQMDGCIISVKELIEERSARSKYEKLAGSVDQS